MAKIKINHRNKTVKLVVKNTFDKFPYDFTIAIIDLLELGALNDFEKNVLAMMVRMNHEQLEYTRQKLSNLLYDAEVRGRD